jgi:two-component system sensor histidine kinase DegS
MANDFDLNAKIVETREKERARIAISLTNGPAQVMSNVVLRTQILERVVERAPDQLVQELEDMERLASASLLDIRRSVFEMRPLVIDELGLVPTLRRYSSDFARETGSKIAISGAEREEILDGHLRIALFRLIQGALTAVVTPNAGTEVEISVQAEEAQLVVRIDATHVDSLAHNRVGHYVDDEYTTETLDLIGGSLQREILSEGERMSVIVPISGS